MRPHFTDAHIQSLRTMSGLTDGQIMHKLRDDLEAYIADLEAQVADLKAKNAELVDYIIKTEGLV
jgi:hypothetical protein